ncbi:MAG: carboxypeptidase-like regulatory domain-containing protein, partial [Candidatus Aminicenantes bacterium]|nr:carboxypeptidase-like regulatory domain-containing protein [Candidatus Aminicenantes bacterium]
QLANGGNITGLVTDSLGTPIGNVNVNVNNLSNQWITNGFTQANGTYYIALPAGSFKVCFTPSQGSNFLSQWYSGKADFASANTVFVVTGVTTSGINATLASGATLSGRVANSSGVGIADVNIGISDLSNHGVTGSRTDTNGNYSVTVLAGTYKVGFYSPLGSYYVSQWYNNQIDFNSGNSITVTTGSTFTANAVLATGGIISGRVTSDGTTGIANVGINVNDSPSHTVQGGATDSYGNYSITVPAGTYKVIFYAPQGSNYITQWYNNKASFDAGDPVSVTTDGTTTANVTLTTVGLLDHFDISPSPIGTQIVNTPFSITITAKDVGGTSSRAIR